MKQKTLLLAVIIMLTAFEMSSQFTVSPTRYDYSKLSRQITAGCTTKMEQAKAIYRWLADNIAYDTSYSIYNADDCFDNKRGVCQAYCELFYRIAEPLALETIIVTGKTKDENGKMSASGHAWLIVKTDQYHIFIDPTWGAGSVNGNTFTRNHQDDYSWFNVSPSWMIFNHFPDEPNMQMLDNTVDFETFMKLPQDITPYYANYGFYAPTILQQAIVGKLNLPKVFNNAGKGFNVLRVPQDGVLQIGEFYEFIVEKTDNCEMAVINDRITKETKWVKNGNQVGIRFMPTKQGTVSLAIKQGDKYSVMLEYKVATPTQENWDKVAQYHPFDLPQFSNIEGFSVESMEYFHINEQRFYKLYKEGKVGKALPKLYEQLTNVELIDAPLTDVLNIGQQYNFIFKAPTGKKLYISNGDSIFKPMDLYTDGTSRMQFTPENDEDIIILIEKGGNNYGYVMLYKSQK